MPSRSAPDAFRRSPGFSLVELLVVVSIMAILAVLSGPALRGLSAANSLSTAGNGVAGLVEFARQSAIGHNAPTAVAVVTAASDATAPYRAYALFQLDPSSGAWTQLERWRFLPASVVFDPAMPSGQTGLVDFFQAPSPALTPDLAGAPVFLLHGRQIDSAATLIFLSSGQIYGQTSPVLLRLVPTSSSTNYYQLILNQDTGRAKVDRP